ncbi:hypothetical protein KORDIASMS9_03899 [Kordia sp. SMS9]|uniref:hypothetical protein n=1 Tax=Kordia sp. SMS9 TaxID=2282170 RepID=UPI000E0D70F9|nr:hypothetical protein [Kordia sp. SMS9]AXG71642.1 hypothetical protein KORDIASMS9_03899 [Kordia sp. SMS9]
MKKRSLSNLKLKKQTVSNLDSRVQGGVLPTFGIICATIYSYLQCEDITHTSKDYDGKHCDIATINDSCLSVCDDKCNDF